MEVVIAGAARARGYTVIDNAPLQDARLSLKARGLLAFCLSLPSNWRYSVAGLVKVVGSDGRDAVRAALRELEEGGYLLRRGLRSPRGEFARVEYVLSGTARRRAEKPPMEKPPMEKPSMPEAPTEEPLQGELPAAERAAQRTPAAAREETAARLAEKPRSENPSAGFPPQQSKYIKTKYQQTTTTTSADAGAAAEPLLSEWLWSPEGGLRCVRGTDARGAAG